MKNKRFLRAMGEIDDSLLARYEAVEQKLSRQKAYKSVWIKWGSVAACLCIIFTSVFLIQRRNDLNVGGSIDVVGDSEKITEAETIGGVNSNTWLGKDIPFVKIQTPSSAPLYYGSDLSVSLGSSADPRSDGLSVVVRLKEVLPDTYTFCDDWHQTEFRLLKMETVEVIDGEKMTDEFLYIVPVDYMTDFSVYNKFILIDIGQYCHEYSVLYNKTQQDLEQCDTAVFGYATWTYHFLDSNFMAFDENGILDKNLWKSNESWIQTTQGSWDYYEDGYTLLQAVEKVRQENAESTLLPLSVQLLETLPENTQNALEKIKSLENGIYIPDSSQKLYHSKVTISASRYINGFVTNESVYIEGNYVKFTQCQFTEKDLMKLPDLTSARTAVVKAFEKGEINPPHIRKYKDMNNPYYGIFCWYAKTDEGVLGVIRVNWTYPHNNSYYSDDAYYIVEYGSKVCKPIDRDALLERIRENDESDFIYTGEYDENGKYPYYLY